MEELKSEQRFATVTEGVDVLRKDVQEKEALELYIPLNGKHTTSLEEEPFDLSEKLKQFFVFDEENKSDPKVTLLLGNTGSGKSVFAQQLYRALCKEYKEGDPIPVWIPLAELENPFEGAVDKEKERQNNC